ncbi:MULTISPECIES: trimethylamine methyltransferase family protein [unclassified Ruegeria]|uniref:trimethylamine methyltransferase family protein n=1 Tax=unclassified Ruegeria TaxID=2625375 RepID=UPI0014888468|nr:MULTISPECIES: trimethylamine methyltransferase family protein [unclassified Ruegeria]NOD77869.1 methyltransferase [Ruegeria sp. HKCCD4332]NOD88100.1 methyltransferase [Ruegeria sp. HKCCD4318]NOE14948.1 methyltransferase [Ruegeria sp. HKCCD4318-2]NOG11449.1 methyltransferase [Ruegeria sp. HKCCD4315]
MTATVRRRGRKQRLTQTTEPESNPPVWPGICGGRFKPLSPQEVALVEETALTLLETLGLSQAIPSMIEKVVAAGGSLTDDHRLQFPRALVRQAISEANRDFSLCGQVPEHDLDISQARAHMSSGGAAPGVFDLDTGVYRDSTLADLYDAARIVDQMDNIHHFSRSVVARDIEDNAVMDLNTAYACLAGTSKHVSISITEPDNVPAIAQLCYAIAGSEEAFRARPFLTVMVCHVVPPMRFAEEACEVLEAAILAGFPVQLISAGQAGATSPATIAGSLVQAVAETLAGLVFARLVDPEVKAIFAPKPLVADLRTGSMCGGGGEQAILMAGAAQMGRHFDLPTSSIAGITDAKCLDAQYGAEKSLAVTMAAHAGSNIVTQAAGMQASLLGVSHAAYVSDNDMLGNILRTLRGIEATPENIAADVIADVCRGEGHYLGEQHTFNRMKSDYFYPEIGDRRTPREWQEDGSQPVGDVAREKAREILSNHFPQHIPDDVDRALRTCFDIRLTRQQTGRSS